MRQFEQHGERSPGEGAEQRQLGLALPHATLSEAPKNKTAVGIVTLAEPIDYGASDGSQVDICIVTMGSPSDRQAHLKILAEISRLTIDTPFLEEIRAAETTEDFPSILRRCLSKA